MMGYTNYQLGLIATAAALFACRGLQAGVDDEILPLPPFPVETEALSESGPFFSSLTVSPEQPQMQFQSAAEVIAKLPGLNLARRGAQTLEPFWEGFAAGEVTTWWQGIPLAEGAPTRTASPLNLIAIGQATTLAVRSLPDASEGPLSLGGRIDVTGGVAGETFDVMVFQDTTREGGGALLQGAFPGESPAIAFSANTQDLGDLPIGQSGGSIDADYRAHNFTTSLKSRSASGVVTRVDAFATQTDLSRNSSLPLDTRDSLSYALSTRMDIPSENGLTRFRFGLSRIDAFLSSEDRPAPATVPIDQIHAFSRADTRFFSFSRKQLWNDTLELTFGIDALRQDQDAQRFRFLKSGAALRDVLWPDLKANAKGLFLSLQAGEGRLVWKTSARIESRSVKANALTAPVVGQPGAIPGSVGDNFEHFNGSRGDSSGTDWAGALLLQVEAPMGKTDAFGLEFGWVRAHPGPTQRYRAFVSALGGGAELGNPNLKPAEKARLALSWKARREALQFELTGYFNYIADAAIRTVLSPDPLIYSFRNADSFHYGVRAAATWQILPPEDPTRDASATLEFGASLVEGELVSEKVDLAELPPASATLNLKAVLPRQNLTLNVGMEAVASTTNPDPARIPIYRDTDAYTLIHCYLHWEPIPRLRLSLSLENAFDELAYAYLQPPVATGAFGPSSGSLARGDAIPLAGRTFRWTLQWTF
jgi:outer membrane receptor protein involved in Fe transport